MRNDIEFDRGQFRVRGDILEVNPVHGAPPIRIEFFGDEIDSISFIHPTSRERIKNLEKMVIFPAKHFIISEDCMEKAIESIEEELEERLNELRGQGKLLEAQRLEQRTRSDIEMLEDMGYCPGIENYSLHFSGRNWSNKPYTLLDYFPDDFLTVIDESHVTIPQIRGMYRGDRSRKRNTHRIWFQITLSTRKPSPQIQGIPKEHESDNICFSHPGVYEISKSQRVVEQIAYRTRRP